MKKEIGNRLKNNWFFLILLVGIICIFVKRYAYLPVSVVSNPDSQIAFCTTDVTLEQTWQPEIKAITGVQVPYYAENDFSCDVQLKVLSDDYSEVLVETTQGNCTFVAGTTGNIDFAFDRTAVTQGERYRIQISLLNADSEGTLQIASGSNYGGSLASAFGNLFITDDTDGQEVGGDCGSSHPSRGYHTVHLRAA